MAHCEVDYYWRDFNGSIPKDAIVAGKNKNCQNVYIGQAYIKQEGLMVVQITHGVQTVFAPIKGIKRTDRNIKILCGHQDNFTWVPATAKDLHVKLLDKHAVIGGHEDDLGNINIGRINYNGSTQVGKINSFFVGNSYFKYVHNSCNESNEIQNFEVLVYNKC